jgi:hypothetical protein
LPPSSATATFSSGFYLEILLFGSWFVDSLWFCRRFCRRLCSVGHIFVFLICDYLVFDARRIAERPTVVFHHLPKPIFALSPAFAGFIRGFLLGFREEFFLLFFRGII